MNLNYHNSAVLLFLLAIQYTLTLLEALAICKVYSSMSAVYVCSEGNDFDRLGDSLLAALWFFVQPVLFFFGVTPRLAGW